MPPSGIVGGQPEQGMPTTHRASLGVGEGHVGIGRAAEQRRGAPPEPEFVTLAAARPLYVMKADDLHVADAQSCAVTRHRAPLALSATVRARHRAASATCPRASYSSTSRLAMAMLYGAVAPCAVATPS